MSNVDELKCRPSMQLSPPTSHLHCQVAVFNLQQFSRTIIKRRLWGICWHCWHSAFLLMKTWQTDRQGLPSASGWLRQPLFHGSVCSCLLQTYPCRIYQCDWSQADPRCTGRTSSWDHKWTRENRTPRYSRTCRRTSSVLDWHNLQRAR